MDPAEHHTSQLQGAHICSLDIKLCDLVLGSQAGKSLRMYQLLKEYGKFCKVIGTILGSFCMITQHRPA